MATRPLPAVRALCSTREPLPCRFSMNPRRTRWSRAWRTVWRLTLWVWASSFSVGSLSGKAPMEICAWRSAASCKYLNAIGIPPSLRRYIYGQIIAGFPVKPGQIGEDHACMRQNKKGNYTKIIPNTIEKSMLFEIIRKIYL